MVTETSKTPQTFADLYTKTMTVIYRGCKRCEKNAGHRIARRVTFKVREHRGFEDHFGNRRLNSRDFMLDGEQFYRYLPHQLPALAVCPCGREQLGQAISGRVNESVACDRRCTGATGHNCECSCGGKNHGADHA